MWKDEIRKEDDDRVNAMLHEFFVKMDSYVEKLQLARMSSPKLNKELKEIEGLSEKLRDRLEDILEPYFSRK
jgi:hypothetical protein